MCLFTLIFQSKEVWHWFSFLSTISETHNGGRAYSCAYTCIGHGSLLARNDALEEEGAPKRKEAIDRSRRGEQTNLRDKHDCRLDFVSLGLLFSLLLLGKKSLYFLFLSSIFIEGYCLSILFCPF